MTENIIPSETAPEPATSPEQVPYAFAAAFNSGDPEAVERVYEPHGLLVSGPAGQSTSGAARRNANAQLVALGVPIEVAPRQVHVLDDLALLIVDWTIAGTSSTGEAVDVRGTATDVARRGADGRWRYVIDNPFGTTAHPPTPFQTAGSTPAESTPAESMPAP